MVEVPRWVTVIGSGLLMISHIIEQRGKFVKDQMRRVRVSTAKSTHRRPLESDGNLDGGELPHVAAMDPPDAETIALNDEERRRRLPWFYAMTLGSGADCT